MWQQNKYKLLTFNQVGNNLVPQIINKGIGINDREIDSIINVTYTQYTNKANNNLPNNLALSQAIIKSMKSEIGGEWFVLDYPSNRNDFEFCFSYIHESNYLIFNIGNTQFQICRLRD